MIRARFYVGSGPNVLPSDFQDRAGTAVNVLEELGIPGATVYPAVGYWRSTIEESLIVEVLASDDELPFACVVAIAGGLAERFHQNVVLWTRETTEGGTQHA